MTDKLTYPDMPGWKGDKSTGRQAAFALAQNLPRRHRQVMEAFAPYGEAGATCDDISATLNLPVYVIRPRASELERKGKLFPVDKRAGGMGHKVTVYSVVKPAEALARAA